MLSYGLVFLISFSVSHSLEVSNDISQKVNISLEGGCLLCGSPCLSSVIAALPTCVAPALAAGGALSGVPVDLSISTGYSS